MRNAAVFVTIFFVALFSFILEKRHSAIAADANQNIADSTNMRTGTNMGINNRGNIGIGTLSPRRSVNTVDARPGFDTTAGVDNTTTGTNPISATSSSSNGIGTNTGTSASAGMGTGTGAGSGVMAGTGAGSGFGASAASGSSSSGSASGSGSGT